MAEDHGAGSRLSEVSTDYVGLAAAAMALALTSGVAIIAVATWLVRTTQLQSPAQTIPSLSSLPSVLLLGGTLLGLAVAATVTWVTLAPVRSPYRQGGLAIATTMATFLVSIVGTFVADQTLGRTGILIFAGLSLAGAWWARRAVERHTH